MIFCVCVCTIWLYIHLQQIKWINKFQQAFYMVCLNSATSYTDHKIQKWTDITATVLSGHEELWDKCVMHNLF